MLYKYLSYSVSYVVKKYDRIWNVGDIYYSLNEGCRNRLKIYELFCLKE
jgi:hypothetical protein